MDEGTKRIEEKIARRHKVTEIKISKNISLSIEREPITKSDILKLLIILAGITSTGASMCNAVIEKFRATTPKEEKLNNTACEKMLEAAYEKDLKKFQKAVKEGVDINSVNQYNQNALMIALSREAYDIVEHIISTPELVNKIDFNCRDIEGNSLEDILKSKLESLPEDKRMQELFCKKEVIVLKHMAKTLKEQKNHQVKEEKAGKTRSDISYAFYTQMLKKPNTK